MKGCKPRLLCIAAAGICLAGCGRKIEQKNSGLHVYVGYSDTIMNFAVEKFKNAYPDIPVVVTEKPEEEDDYEYDQQLSAQLMSGEGADVFFIQNYWDIDKLLAAGAFADLTEIYDSSRVFQDEDFIQDIMEAGVIGGKRVFLPMECNIPLLITTEEALEETGFAAKRCTDFDSFIDEARKFMLGENYDRRLFRMDITAGNCLYWAGYPVVEDREIVWDIEETREYYEWYKEFYKREGGIGEYYFGDLRGAAEVRDKKCLFENCALMYSDMDVIRALHTVGDPAVLPIYNKEGGITATLKKAVAVRANSENMGNVEKFLEILFDGETMKTPGAYKREVSVRRSVHENYFNSLLKKPFMTEVDGFPMELPELEKEEFDAYFAYIDQISRVVYRRGWAGDFREEMNAYLTGGASYEEAAENAKRKLEFYLSE
ncbi:MAG: carbohydrate ABC transporter substrate-binding protein [Eubacterium sp.]|nr:carbohydrate ABC transporter substrate-binding protein [Eubacterium sp.]MCI8919917.1 carbohydrate ABC transporter substrate-binding protein [Eubacterium sp.]